MNIPAKHTPGPWSVWKKSLDPAGREDWAILSSENRIIAEAFWKVETDEYMPAEANARLIAAAPELLEALEAMAEWHEDSADDEPLIIATRAAIAKARGT